MNFQVLKNKRQMLKEKKQNKKAQNKTIKHKLENKQNPTLVLHFPQHAHMQTPHPSLRQTVWASAASLVLSVVLPSYSRWPFPSSRHWCCLLGTTFMYLLNSSPCLHNAYKTNKQTCVSLRTPGFLEFSLISLGQMYARPL